MKVTASYTIHTTLGRYEYEEPSLTIEVDHKSVTEAGLAEILWKVKSAVISTLERSKQDAISAARMQYAEMMDGPPSFATWYNFVNMDDRAYEAFKKMLNDITIEFSHEGGRYYKVKGKFAPYGTYDHYIVAKPTEEELAAANLPA